MKSVNILDLAKSISPNIKIVGKRLGEKINEKLINANEINFTHNIGDYLLITKNASDTPLKDEYSSLTAPKMNLEEIKKIIYEK